MSDVPKTQTEIRTVTVDDLLEVLALGLRDFRAAPAYGLFFSGIYTIGGWLMVLMLIEFDLPYLVYPLAAGFALIAPFIACRVNIGDKTGHDVGAKASQLRLI